jgi:histone H3/H4
VAKDVRHLSAELLNLFVRELVERAAQEARDRGAPGGRAAVAGEDVEKVLAQTLLDFH